MAKSHNMKKLYAYVTFSESDGFTMAAFDTKAEAVNAAIADAIAAGLVKAGSKREKEMREGYKEGLFFGDDDIFSKVVEFTAP